MKDPEMVQEEETRTEPQGSVPLSFENARKGQAVTVYANRNFHEGVIRTANERLVKVKGPTINEWLPWRLVFEAE